ncbi:MULTISPECIES: hypothetical protein [Acinetobacter]|uniref:hypothetical protein n=2 Tax=Moraxellaceae TaxID=468 RepID=UPI000BDF7100|nr:MULTISPECIES: hypothetical protein [Acinetobacter]
MKKCSCCQEIKPFSDYTKSKSNKDGHGIYCKPCRKIKKTEEYFRNKQKYLDKAKSYREKFPEKVSEAKKLCYQNKIDQYKQNHRKYYQENKEAVLVQAAEYREANKEEIRKRDNAYKARNREKLRLKQSEYQRLNSELRNEYTRKYRKNRRQADKLFAIKQNMRARFRFELAKRGEEQLIKANQYLGCSWIFLRDYLAEKFTDGMSWENYGDWHVDHVIPLASAKSKEELIRLWHYSNLQPLWASDNILKGAKMPDQLVA